MCRVTRTLRPVPYPCGIRLHLDRIARPSGRQIQVRGRRGRRSGCTADIADGGDCAGRTRYVGLPRSDDDQILATAVAAKAACIVTGDKDLLVLQRYLGIEILSPSEFADFEEQF